MKLLLMGDGHFTNVAPEKRIDDYYKTVRNKSDQIFAIYNEYDCDYLMQVGDLFDTPHVSNEVISDLMASILRANATFLCVYGQHDIFGHSELTYVRSPMRILCESGAAELLTAVPKCIGENASRPFMGEFNSIMAYGCSFGQPIPEIKSPD